MNNRGVSGSPQKDFEHARGPCNSAYAVNLTFDRRNTYYIRHTTYDIPTIYKISIEHPRSGARFARPITFICGQKNYSYCSNRLTFSNFRVRTSRRIYRLALPLLSPKTLSSSSKSRIFLYNVHLALLVRIDYIILAQMHRLKYHPITDPAR